MISSFRYGYELFYDSENFALTYDVILGAVALNLGACVFRDDNAIADLYGHRDLVSVYDATGTYGNDLCYLRLFLGGTGENQPRLGGLFHLYCFYDNSVSKRFDRHNNILLFAQRAKYENNILALVSYEC